MFSQIRFSLSAVIVAVSLIPASSALPASAATYTWNGGGGAASIADGGGTWSDGTGTWYDGTNYSGTWSDGNTAIFGGGSSGAAGTVAISGPVAPASLTFNQPFAGNYTLTGGGTLNLGSGTLADNATGVTAMNTNLVMGTTSAAYLFTVASGGTLQIGGAVLLSASGSPTTQNHFAMYGPGVLQFLNTTGTLSGGGMGFYGGTVDFNGANLAIPGDLFRWNNTAPGSSTQVIIENGANVQLSGILNAGSNSKMGLTAVSGGTAAQTLTILGGTLNYASGNVLTLQVGEASGDVATVNQSGGLLGFTAATASNGVELGITSGATGTYNLGGGTLLTPEVFTSAGTSTFNFNGGTLAPNFSNGTFTQGLTAANVQQNGGTINTNGYNVTVSQVLSHSGTNATDGGLTKSGAGMLTLTGANTYNGPTTISAGTLQVGNGATNGSIGASGNVVDNATLVFNVPSANSQTCGGAISGNGSLAMIGNGVLKLNGSSTSFAGSVAAGGGTLAVNGPLAAPGGVTVAAGATFSGSGSITSGATTVAGGGILNFGQASGGEFNFANLSFAGGATINLSDSGVQYAGTPAFSAATLGTASSPINLYVTNLPTSGTMQIVQYSLISGAGTGAFQMTSPVNAGRSFYTLVPAGNAIDLVFSNDYPFWVGLGNSQWNTTATNNWYANSTSAATTYMAGNGVGDTVVFDDRALSYSGSASQVVTIGPANVSPGSVTFSNTAVSYTIQGSSGITGSATTLAVNGAGAVTLATSNNFGGGTTLGAPSGSGLLNLGNSAALGTGPINISGGSLDNTSGVPMTLPGNNAQNWAGSGFTFVGSNPLNMGTGAVAIRGTQVVQVNASTLTVGGAISGIGALTLQGAGVLLLTGSSNYSGSTTVSSGTLQLGDGTPGHDGSINGTSALVSTTPVSLVYDIAGSQTVPYTIEATAATANLIKSGTGMLTLSGNGAFIFCPTTISSGTLQVVNNSTNAISALSNSNGIIDNGLLYVNVSSATNSFTIKSGISGSGIISATAELVTFNGNVTTGGSQSYAVSNAGGSSHSNGGNISTTLGTTITLSTSAAGAGISLTGDFGTSVAAGGNYLVIDTSADNGPVNLNATFGRAGVWNRLANVTVNAGTGTITWSGTDASNGSQGPVTLNGGAINISSNIVSGASGASALTLTLNNSLPSTVSGVLSGGASLVLGGPSIVTLAASNTYTGSTTISSGTLQLGTGQSGQDGAINSTSSVDDEGLLAYNLLGNQTAPYAISGGGGIVKTGSGALTLSSANNFYGGSTAVNQGTLLLNASSLSSSAVTVANGAVFGGNGSANTVSVAAGGAVQAGYSGSGSLTLSELDFAGSGSVYVAVLASFYTASPAVNVFGAVNTSGGNSVTITVGNLTGATTGVPYELISYNTIGGSGTEAFHLAQLPARSLGVLSFPAGQVDLTLTGYDFLHWTGTVSNQWNTTTPNWALDSTGGTATYIDGNPTGGDTVVFDDGAGSRSTVNIASNVQPSSVTFSNTASSYVLQGAAGIAGATPLNVNGAGLVTICNSNAYTGPTTINGGTLQVGNGQSGQDGSINGTSGLTNNSTLVYDIAGSQTVPYAIGGTGNMLMTGTGLVTLTGSTTLSGTATISSGSLQVGNGGTSGTFLPGGGIINNASLTYNFSPSSGIAALPAAGISGSGSVSVTARKILFDGDVATGGSQNYTGAGNINGAVTGGSVTLSASAARAGISLTGDFGTSAPGSSNYLVVDTSAGNGPVNLDVTFGRPGVWNRLANVTVNAGTGTITWSGTNAGNGNGSTGPVTLNGGAIDITSNVEGGGGMTLTFDNSLPSTVSGYLYDSMSIVAAGSSTLTLSSTVGNFYLGSTTVQSGVLQLGNSASLGNHGAAWGGLAVNGGTLDLAGNSVTAYSFSGVAGTVTSSSAGAATLTVSQSTATAFGGTISDGAGQLALVLGDLGGNSGMLTLSGSNTFSGGTTIAGGELILTNNEALADGSSLIVGSASAFGLPAPAGSPAAVPAATPVPEPGTLALSLVAAVAAGWSVWRRRKGACRNPVSMHQLPRSNAGPQS